MVPKIFLRFTEVVFFTFYHVAIIHKKGLPKIKRKRPQKINYGYSIHVLEMFCLSFLSSKSKQLLFWLQIVNNVLDNFPFVQRVKVLVASRSFLSRDTQTSL